MEPGKFNFNAYADYESSLLERCRNFRYCPKGDSAVLVYCSAISRLAPEVFSYGCRDMKDSLCRQLGALQESMSFKTDVPNFLEPWYGIGTVAGAFGLKYIWRCGRAPAVRPGFSSAADALGCSTIPVEQTPIGRHTLNMIDYFIEKTDGRLPMSLACTQSALDVAGSIVDINSLFVEMYDNPRDVMKLLDRIVWLMVDFIKKQVEQIGRVLVWPGHGFASCRCFEGLGMSDDNALMISDEHFLQFATPADEHATKPFGGLGFHCCGNWSAKIDAVRRIRGLRVVDAAFTPVADPAPNPPEAFAEGFSNTGIVINARITGGCKTIVDVVKRLWRPPMRLIVVTDCETPEEQADVYDRVHEICG